MANGFIGNASTTYLNFMQQALMSAANVHSGNAQGGAAVNERPPFTVSDTAGGGFSTGVGSSSNVVTDQHTYNGILQKVTMTDDRISGEFYNATREIENMLSTSYIVPQTVQKCLALLDLLQASLTPFRSLTDEKAAATRSFVGNVTNIS